MTMLVLFGSLFLMMAVGVPIAVALAGSSLFYVLAVGMPDVVVLHRMVNGIDSFPLLAIPFFILAGNLMNSAQITERIFGFAMALFGWMRGGLGHVNVAGSVLFAGMSGAAVADAGGLGTIEIKAMRDHGYDDRFAVGITAASSTIGPIIPPSLPLVVYGVMANASVGQLFAAGFIPGIGMAVALMAWVAWTARRRGYKRDAAFSVRRLAVSVKEAFLALMTPVILIGGMVSGMFTPTEAAIAAVVYAMFLGMVVYRTLSLRDLLRVSMDTIETTAVILIIVAGASIFGWVLTSAQATERLSTWVLGLTDNPILILLLANLLLLVVGCFLETIAAITILVPVLLPIVMKIGVDPVQFGIVMVLNLMIGLLTPPVGMVLYVLSRVANLPFEECAKACAPFLIPLVGVLLLVTFWPGFSMWLPTLVYR
ncbi:TRAP transporter large permease [Arenibaculum sp.]|jgi:tripartite ATP-independent transporter DctM subunit|uniref:TRAP transporter large permease n=1 Tax=Arenibaculum sp. TaxID=2865862 RepID=UPI002E0E493C|nr:TRAP transporter large permease [Arenibaculum sp.]